MNTKIFFPIAIGVTDGIITTLMLVSALIIHHLYIDISLAIRVAFGSAFVGTFSYFIAEYSSMRVQLSRESRHLNLSSPAYLLRSQPGRDILKESVLYTSLTGICSFSGSFIPLIFEVLIPSNGYIAITVAVLALAMTGFVISRSISGNPFFWVTLMVFLGVIVSVIGNALQLIS
jgi:VIT1/CCC1 family predicted Fe2+/Mn2+ transporter